MDYVTKELQLKKLMKFNYISKIWLICNWNNRCISNCCDEIWSNLEHMFEGFCRCTSSEEIIKCWYHACPSITNISICWHRWSKGEVEICW